VRDRRQAFDAMGTQVAFVHMGTEDLAEPFFREHGVADVARVADPQARLYEAFGLKRGTVVQLFGPAVWARGLSALAKGHGVGAWVGDPTRMPGAFLIHHGEVLKAFRHASIGEVPDYLALGRA
jgi:hypothetical protein